VLASDTERHAAGHNNLDPWRGSEQPPHHGGRCQHVLEIVDDKQQLLIADSRKQRLLGQLPRVRMHAERVGDSRNHVRRITDRCKVDQHRAVGKRGRKLGCNVEGKPSLADAGWTKQGQQAEVATTHHGTDVCNVIGTPKQRCRAAWQCQAMQRLRWCGQHQRTCEERRRRHGSLPTRPRNQGAVFVIRDGERGCQARSECA
jgi:hypothetical protein